MPDHTPGTPDAPGTHGTPDAAAEAQRPRAVLCPYCGHRERLSSTRCTACGGLFEPLSREATQIAMGPWQVRDENAPFRPGFSYQTLRRMIRAGRVTKRTILRGPSTQQFWALAANARGVAHLLGQCHQCGAAVREHDTRCPSCQADFSLPFGRDELGLRYPTEDDAARAQQRLDAQLTTPGQPTRSHAAPAGQAGHQGDIDPALAILDRAIGTTPPPGPATAPPHPDAAPTSPTSAAGIPQSAAYVPTVAGVAHMPNATPPPPRAGLSPALWALIALNALALIAVAWLGYVLYLDAATNP